MSPIPYVAVLAAVAGLLAQPAVADGTHFRVKPITVAGGANVSANAINNNGMIAGTYGGGLNGFILSGTALTTLPPTFANCPDGCVAVPTAINAAGDVVGTTFFGDVYAFLWHNGAYVAAGSFDLGLTGDAAAAPVSTGRARNSTITLSMVEYSSLTSEPPARWYKSCR
ncbi:MAG: hypothetical protein WDN04_15645 [Rhodospirillales bacterium]